MADRYVNYDKLLEERHRLGLDEMSKIHKVNAFNHFIDNIPTADVVEVKHGHFIEIKGEKETLGTLTCSCCLYTYARLYPRNYCPHCGAKMEKETRKEQA